ncbi:SAF domain-containing protein [Kitasatospora sp. NPDC085895]|uniref:SAF domain-containing protein n=1 Tax=Kitasatospora sp. NPDC085895 TaxID=3155057 RepID=UPI00344C785F
MALIAVGSLSGAYLYVATGQRAGVLALARDVAPGSEITAADLVEARIASDPVLKSIPAQDAKKVIGKRAVSALPAGSLLTEKSLTSGPLVAAGQQLVPVPLAQDRIPASALTTGQKVQLVHAAKDLAASAQGTPAAQEANISATVVRVGKPSNSGDVVVDVAVASGSGSTLARWAARGEVSFLLLPAEG